MLVLGRELKMSRRLGVEANYRIDSLDIIERLEFFDDRSELALQRCVGDHDEAGIITRLFLPHGRDRNALLRDCLLYTSDAADE